jgi:hypothetical protein
MQLLRRPDAGGVLFRSCHQIFFPSDVSSHCSVSSWGQGVAMLLFLVPLPHSFLSNTSQRYFTFVS